MGVSGSALTREISSWTNTRREIPYLGAPMYYHLYLMHESKSQLMPEKCAVFASLIIVARNGWYSLDTKIYLHKQVWYLPIFTSSQPWETNVPPSIKAIVTGSWTKTHLIKYFINTETPAILRRSRNRYSYILIPLNWMQYVILKTYIFRWWC